MSGIEPALLALSAGASVASTVGTIQEGRAAGASAKFQAKQYQLKAQQENAMAQRQAVERKRQIDLASSRARAVSAASGVVSASPSVANILAGLDREADYAFDSAMVAGEESATGLRTASDVQLLAGKQARQASIYGALANVSQFASTAYGMSSGGMSSGAPKTPKAPSAKGGV